MKIKSYFLISIVFLAMFLVACAKAPAATPATTTGPSAPSEAPAATGTAQGETMEKPVAAEAKFKITKQTALKNPSRVVVAIDNIGDVDSSIELNVSLVYARKVVASKTATASINKGESKEITVDFPDVSSFISYTIEGAGLINPVKPSY